MCKLMTPFLGPPLRLLAHQQLHQEGRQLITSWFHKAWMQRDDDEAVFESFIFAWFSVNAWAACVTGVDQDADYVRRLARDAGLQKMFANLLRTNPDFRAVAFAFHSTWPIFKAQEIRRANVFRDGGMSRRDLVNHYFQAGIETFEPACWLTHTDLGEPVPLDWPHTLVAIYRVRNNLFHGEKSAHSEMDRSIVKAAFDTLLLFFRSGGIL